MSIKPMTAEQQKEHDANYNIERVLIDNAVNVVSVDSAEDCGTETVTFAISNKSIIIEGLPEFDKIARDVYFCVGLSNIMLANNKTTAFFWGPKAFAFDKYVRGDNCYENNKHTLKGDLSSNTSDKLFSFNEFNKFDDLLISQVEILAVSSDESLNKRQLSENLVVCEIKQNLDRSTAEERKYINSTTKNTGVKLLGSGEFLKVSARNGFFYKALKETDLYMTITILKKATTQYKINK